MSKTAAGQPRCAAYPGGMASSTTATPAASKLPGPATGKPRIPVPGATGKSTPDTAPKPSAHRTNATVNGGVQNGDSHATTTTTMMNGGSGLQAPKPTKLTIPSRKVRKFTPVPPSTGPADGDISASAESSPEKSTQPGRKAPASGLSRAGSSRLAAAAGGGQEGKEAVAVAVNGTAGSHSPALSQLRKHSTIPSPVRPSAPSSNTLQVNSKQSRLSPKTSPRHQMLIRSYSEEPTSPGRQRTPAPAPADRAVEDERAVEAVQKPASGLKGPSGRSQIGGGSSVGGDSLHRTMSCSNTPISSPSSNDEKPLTRQLERSPRLGRPVHRMTTAPVLACTNAVVPVRKSVIQTSDSDISPSHCPAAEKRSLPPPVPAKSRKEPSSTTAKGGVSSTTEPVVSRGDAGLISSERPHNPADGRSNSSSDSELKHSSMKPLAEQKYHVQCQSKLANEDPGTASNGESTMIESTSVPSALSPNSALATSSEQSGMQQPFSPMNIALLVSGGSSPRHSPQSSNVSDGVPVNTAARPADAAAASQASPPAPHTSSSSQEHGVVKNSVQTSSPLAALPEVPSLGSRDNPIRKSWKRPNNQPQGGSRPSIATGPVYRPPLPVSSVAMPTASQSPTPVHSYNAAVAAAASLDGIQTVTHNNGGAPGHPELVHDQQPPPDCPDWTGNLQRGGSFSARTHAQRLKFPRRLSSDNILDGPAQRYYLSEGSRGGSSSDESPMGMVTNSSRAAVSFRPRARTVHSSHPTTWDGHRDSGVSMTTHYSPQSALVGGEVAVLREMQVKKLEAGLRRTSDTSSSTSSSPVLERYAVGPAAQDERPTTSSPAGAIVSPHRSLNGSKKSLVDQKVLEARLTELEDRNSQLQNEVVNTTRAMSQLQDIIQKKDDEVSNVLQAFKTKEDELEHIYSLLRAAAPADSAPHPQASFTTDDLTAARRESPSAAAGAGSGSAVAAQHALAATGSNSKSVTWDESSMSAAMAMEKKNDKKKRPSWKKFNSFLKHKAKRTSSGTVIAGDESETNNDDMDESSSPVHVIITPTANMAVDELQRLKAELQFTKAELARTQLTHLTSRGGQDHSPSMESETASQLTASSVPSNGLFEAVSQLSGADQGGGGTMCDVFLTVDGERFCGGHLSIGMTTTWLQLDQAVSRAVVDHVRAIDPVESLGLSSSSVKSYSVGRHARTPSTDIQHQEEQLLPDSLFVGADRPIDLLVSLRGTSENDCDELAYKTVISRSLLRNYVSLVEEQPVIITGPTSCGKSYLARQLLIHILARSGVGADAILTLTPPRDISTPAQLENHVKTVMTHFCKRLPSDSTAPLGLVIEDLDSVACLDRQALASLRYDGARRVYVIITASRWPLCNAGNTVATAAGSVDSSAADASNGATSSATPSRSAMAGSQCASIRLVTHHQPVKGMLARYLNKKRLTEASSSASGELIRVAEWLPSAWEHINTFLHAIVSPHAVLGPCQYLSSPVTSAEACVWFSNLWNFHVLPYIIEAATWPLAAPLVQRDWYTPITWLLESSPWQHRSRSSGAEAPAAVLNLETLRQEDMVWSTQRVASGRQSSYTAQLPSDLLALNNKNGLVSTSAQEDRLMRLLERVVMTSSGPANSR